MRSSGEVVKVAGALSDPHRLRAFMALRKGELCACQIIELLKLAPSTVSKHMSVLRQAGLVVGRKEGRWMYYRLPGKWRDTTAGRMAGSCLDGLKQDDAIRADYRRLNAICSVDLKALCKARRGATVGK